jgi:hypothetical protein
MLTVSGLYNTDNKMINKYGADGRRNKTEKKKNSP